MTLERDAASSPVLTVAWLATAVVLTIVVLAVGFVILVVDPAQTIAVDVDALYRAEALTGDLQRDVALVATWALVATGVVWIVARHRLAKGGPAMTGVRELAWMLGLGGVVLISSFLPSSFVGVSLVVQGELSGLASPAPPQVPVLLAVQLLGPILAIAGFVVALVRGRAIAPVLLSMNSHA